MVDSRLVDLRRSIDGRSLLLPEGLWRSIRTAAFGTASPGGSSASQTTALMIGRRIAIVVTVRRENVGGWVIWVIWRGQV